MRIASNLSNDVLSGIDQSEAALQTAFEQVSTGQRVNVPGDDPSAAAAMVQNQAATDALDQYQTNDSAGLREAQAADSVLTSVVSLLNQAVTLGTEGANGSTSTTNRQALAKQIQGILASVVAQANTNYEGVAIFSGTAGASVAFAPSASSATGYSYQGDTGTSQVQVGDSLSVAVNMPGSTLFTNPDASVLGSLSDLANALNTGTMSSIGNATGEVSAALNYVTAQHAVFGNSISQLNSQETFLSQEKVTLSAQASDLVDVDTATAAENLSQAEVQNSAVLAAAAKVLPTTLLDYLK